MSWRAALASALAASVAAPVAGAVGGGVSFATDEPYRGRSLSAGRPVATVELAYDDADGFYAGGSVAGVMADERPRLLSVAGYAGYAVRTRAGPVIDVGVVNRTFTRFYRGGESASEFEVYAGVIGRRLSARAYLAPDYYGRGATAVYAELAATIPVTERLRIGGHAGLLAPLSGELYPGVTRAQYDWRLSASRRFGRLGVSLAWSGLGPAADFYRGRRRPGDTLTLGVRRAF